MPASCSLMGILPLGPDARVEGRGDILRLGQCLKPLGTDFLLFLASSDLRLLDVRRIPRTHQSNQGFPISKAIDLAREADAAGMIVVQERSPGDEAVRPQDIELTTAIRLMLDETGIELLDHLLLLQDKIVSVGGLLVDGGRGKIRSEHPLDCYGPRMESEPKPDYGNPAYWQRASENYEFMTVELGGRERARQKLILITIIVIAGALAVAGFLGLTQKLNYLFRFNH